MRRIVTLPLRVGSSAIGPAPIRDNSSTTALFMRIRLLDTRKFLPTDGSSRPLQTPPHATIARNSIYGNALQDSAPRSCFALASRGRTRRPSEGHRSRPPDPRPNPRDHLPARQSAVISDDHFDRCRLGQTGSRIVTSPGQTGSCIVTSLEAPIRSRRNHFDPRTRTSGQDDRRTTPRGCGRSSCGDLE